MNLGLEGKTLVITGAGRGIGAATAEAFGAAGARVVVGHYQTPAEGAEVVERIRAKGGEAVLLEADVRDEQQVVGFIEAAAAAFGGIDILINNVGAVVELAPAETISVDVFDRVMNLNARSVVLACREVIPHMRRAGGGSIINISSIAARVGSSPKGSLYGGAKGFVSAYTKSIAKELAPDRIRVNAVSPGVVRTAFHDGVTTAERLDEMSRAVPLGRAGVPGDMVGAFLFLASEAMAGYVTGQVIEVNGGLLMA